jgi:hypothetical protein
MISAGSVARRGFNFGVKGLRKHQINKPRECISVDSLLSFYPCRFKTLSLSAHLPITIHQSSSKDEELGLYFICLSYRIGAVKFEVMWKAIAVGFVQECPRGFDCSFVQVETSRLHGILFVKECAVFVIII